VEGAHGDAALGAVRFRAATARDATILAILVAQSFEQYREFAPTGWQPRPAYLEEAELAARLERGDGHARAAFAPDGALAGFATWAPAFTRSAPPERVAGRAHLSGLFVGRAWWGTGLAGRLLGWTTDGMRDSGFATAQLWTPRDHGRARAFYEREGWHATAEAMYSPELALDLVLYERALG